MYKINGFPIHQQQHAEEKIRETTDTQFPTKYPIINLIK